MQEHYVPTDDAISSYAIPLRDTYEYDYLNRITQANGLQRTTSGSWISVYGQGFVCDRWGNRTINAGTTWGNAIPNTVFTVNTANNRLNQLGYDLAGNATSDSTSGITQMNYDAENRMTSALKGSWSYYVYDADGKRVRRITGGVETWHIYGFGGELIAEYPLDGAAGSPSKEYGYRGGQLLIVGDMANVRWTVTDSLGTPRIVAGKTGALSDVTRHDYLPFGEELFVNMGTGSIRSTTQGYSTGNTPDGLRKKFGSKERDNETGLDYFLARYYSSAQGRFISPDEFTGGPDELFVFADAASANPTFYADLTNPQSLNKYQYTYNNPLRYTDPDGHCPECPYYYYKQYVEPKLIAVDRKVEQIKTDLADYGKGLAKSAANAVIDMGNLGAMVTGDAPIARYEPSNEVQAMAMGSGDKLILLSGGAGKGVPVNVAMAEGKGVAVTTGLINGVKVTDKFTGAVLEGTVNLKPTLDRIASGGKFPHKNDGSVFQNKEGLLPNKPNGYYREYVVPTPGAKGPGPQRIITGNGGERYYTPDHYGTFIPLNK
jgi:RHS repeat-associated protein